METRGPRRWRWPLLCIATFVMAVACATFVPPSGWNPANGPVVPHDTFPADCSLCHEGGDWHTLRPDFTFDHEARTGVPLLGAHAETECLMCHNDRGPVAMFAAQGCAGCHADPHLQRLGRNCRDCHDERTWVPRDAIAKHDRTRFPLIGAHAATACVRCHGGAQVGNFAGAPVECVQCHQTDFARATDPNHAVLNFSQSCERCHLPVGWRPARFDHPGSFPLSNRHQLPCASCHTTPGSFVGLSSACASCHLPAYEATSNPPHVAFQMSQQCQNCHGTSGGNVGNWNHPFPIQSGRHAGMQCFACHDNPGNRPAFTCTNCHDHRQSRMDDKHDEVGGYVWATASCYACHPTGRR